MTTLTLKLSKALDEQLTALAKRRRLSKKAIARKAIEVYLVNQGVIALSATTLTVGDLVGHLAGCLDGGPPDLSTNKKYFEGFGE